MAQRARRISFRAGVLGCVLTAASAAALPALELDLPASGTLQRELVGDPDSYRVPVAPWMDGTLPVIEVTGRVLQQAWRIQIEGITTLQVMRPLVDQLEAAGYEVLFECGGQACGGFDFRFGTRVLPAPDMYVDLFDYRFLSARAPGPEYVTLLVSRSSGTAYVQIIHVGADGSAPPKVAPSAGQRPVARPSQNGGANGAGISQIPTLPAQRQPLARSLVTQGHVILTDLEFDTGSSSLGAGPFGSLTALARYLRDDPTRRVALVGHTDTVGDLQANIALSRRRANAVRARLIEAYDVPASQLEAEGMGYLSPIASNLTPEGREANRRVEAVLLNTE